MNRKQFIDKWGFALPSMHKEFKQDLTSLIEEDRKLFANWIREEGWQVGEVTEWFKKVDNGHGFKQVVSKTTAQLIELYNGREGK
jgi:hypothetical protein